MISESGNQFHPDYVSPPGASLLEVLEVLGMTQAELAERTGRPRKTINEIVRGRASITPETALQLERALGVPSSFWNNRQCRHNEYLARCEEQERLKTHVDWVARFPYSAMVRLGWIENERSALEKLRRLLSFFGVVSPEAWETRWRQIEFNFRQSAAFSVDKFNLTAWLRKGEQEAHKINCAPYDKKRFIQSLGEIRALTTETVEVFLPTVIELCASCGVALVFVPELPKTRVSGATYWISNEKAVLQLSLRHRTDDHLWFSFFHEVAHIILHPKRAIFLERDVKTGAQEQQANQFSTEFLVPSKALTRLVETRPLTPASIKEFAAAQGIAAGIVVGQLQHKEYLEWNSEANHLKRSFVWE